MTGLFEQFGMLIERGGYVIFPLLLMSVIGLALIFERAWFWLSTHSRQRSTRLTLLHEALRSGNRELAQKISRDDASPYGELTRSMLSDGASDAVAVEVVERQRPRIDRFMVSLSTIVTAAPLLGILGTVIGIIRSFNLLGQTQAQTDLSMVSSGIAEALLTTALGLVVALLVLFPYMIFRGQVDRATGRMESLIAAAQEGFQPGDRRAASPSHRTGTGSAAYSTAAQ